MEDTSFLSTRASNGKKTVEKNRNSFNGPIINAQCSSVTKIGGGLGSLTKPRCKSDEVYLVNKNQMAQHVISFSPPNARMFSTQLSVPCPSSATPPDIRRVQRQHLLTRRYVSYDGSSVSATTPDAAVTPCRLRPNSTFPPPISAGSTKHSSRTGSPQDLPRKRPAFNRLATHYPNSSPMMSSSPCQPADEFAPFNINTIWQAGCPRGQLNWPATTVTTGKCAASGTSPSPRLDPLCSKDDLLRSTDDSNLPSGSGDGPLDLTAAGGPPSTSIVDAEECTRRQASLISALGDKPALLLRHINMHLGIAPVRKQHSTFTGVPETPTSAQLSPLPSTSGPHEIFFSNESARHSPCLLPAVSVLDTNYKSSGFSCANLNSRDPQKPNTDVSQNFKETEETLALLSLNGPQDPIVSKCGFSHEKPSWAAPSHCPQSPPPSIHAFLQSTLEMAYDELLRHWASLEAFDWPTKIDTDGVIIDPVTPTKTAIFFDPAMLSHACICPNGNNPQVHPEHPLRIISILEKLSCSRLQIPLGLLRLDNRYDTSPPLLLSDGPPLAFFCRWMRARMARREELAIFHTAEHVARYCPLMNSEDGEADSGLAMPSAEEGCRTLLSTLLCGGVGVDSDTVWNAETTSVAARLAVGQVMCLAHNLVTKALRNGFALVHPPGHHAEPDQAMGYCYFNSVAIAALSILQHGLARRVLVLDWDIHHGNGTQLAAGRNPGLLYISLHCYDQGTFFTGTGAFPAGVEEKEGTRRVEGEGGVINIPWGCTSTSNSSTNRDSWLRAVSTKCGGHLADTSIDSGVQMMSQDRSTSVHTTPLSRCHGGCHASSSSASSLAGSVEGLVVPSLGSESPTAAAAPPPAPGISDAEYLAAFRTLVLPIASEFDPDVVLVSAGFDGAAGRSSSALGGYEISPGAFAWMTRQCMSLAKGSVGLVLEGGYVASVTADCVSSCLNALLLPNPPPAVWNAVGNNSPGQRLATLEDCLCAARYWISPSELSRAPRPEAVKTLLEVAAVHAKLGRWKCLSSETSTRHLDFARPFNKALEQERDRLRSVSRVLLA